MRISLEELTFSRSDPREGRRTDRTMKSREMIVLVDSFEVSIARNHEKLRTLMSTLGTGVVTREEIGILIQDEARLSALETDEERMAQKTSDNTMKSMRAVRMQINGAKSDIAWATRQANRYRVEIHKKYSIALACLIFMMIGAPLGLYVRKGGLGTSAALAVAIFMFHWISLANGEKLADRGFLEPWLGMWLADIVTGILAIWLTFYVWRDIKTIPQFSLNFFRRSERGSYSEPDPGSAI